MSPFPIQELVGEYFPPLLKEIPDQPKKLYFKGTLPDFETNHFLAVVGSRKYSEYGKRATKDLIEGLRGYPIVIISGLALGTDSLAHKAALAANLTTIAVPGSGLDEKVLYPRSNVRLAEEILEHGGALISEFEPGFKATLWSFPQRNRIMAGLSHAVLVTEAAQKSGTLITSKLAGEYNRDILTVPGSIYSPSSAGPHMLLKLGAVPITSSADILSHFGLLEENMETKPLNFAELSEDEKSVVEILKIESLPKEELFARLGLPAAKTNIILSTLELRGIVEERLGKVGLRK